MERQMVSTRKTLRRRPLETVGASAMAIAQIINTRSQNFDGRVGSFAQKIIRSIAFFFTWIINPLKCHFLAIFSSADDHILALQETLETHVPSSNSFFNKIQDVLLFTETLPNKFEKILAKFPSVISQVATLDWVIVYAISWLDLLTGVLMRWRDKNTKKNKEKEILVDKSFSRSGSEFLEEEEKKQGEDKGSRPGMRRATYKEALQKGSHREDGVREGDKTERESNGSDSSNGSSRGDPILELFETGWILKPIKRSSRSASSLTLTHSSSYVM